MTWPFEELRVVNIETVSGCNLSCLYCSLTKKPLEFMSPERIALILKNFSGARSDLLVSLYLGGEPLLHPRFPDLIRVARDLGFLNLRIHTNGTVNRPGLWEEIVEAGLGEVIFSVDGEDATDYERIRGVSFERVRRSIEDCLSVSAGRTRVGVLCLVGRGRPLELNRDLRDLLPQLHRELVVVDRPHSWLVPGEIPESVPSGAPVTTPCFFLRHYMAVNIRGEYLPCCLCLNSEATFGSVEGLSALGAWQGPMEGIRIAQVLGEKIEPCSRCERRTPDAQK